MADIIIVVIIVVLLGFALKSSIKHFKGEGACCGGGSSPKKTKEKTLDGPVIGRKTVKIAGMHCEHCVNSVTAPSTLLMAAVTLLTHCEHCVNSVTAAINKVEGASAKVNLNSGSAVVSYDREISEMDLKHAVENAGFEVVSIT